MRKIKKQIDKADEVIELLTTTLDEYFTPFMLMAKSEKPQVRLKTEHKRRKTN